MAPRRSARISSLADQKPLEAATAISKVNKSSKSKNKASKENGITKEQKESPTRKAQKKTKKEAAASAAEKALTTPQTPPRKQKGVTSVADNHNLRLTPPPSRLDRPVEPHRTNATLVTPRGSSVVAYPSLEDTSPSKTGLPRPIATTGNLLEKALEHLTSVDARLKPLIEQHHCRIFSPEGLAEQIDPFDSLISSIMAQQVSGAAAKSIKNKFLDLFDSSKDVQTDAEGKRRFPTPAQVAKLDIPTLRTAGLSQRKAEYVQGLAEKFASGELSTQKLLRASDEEVMEMLIAVRGLGRWSVEMFSCFALKRTDVFSTGDLGVQRGCAAFVGKDVNKLKAKGGKFKYMSESDMLELAEKFRPYRSLFMWYMWRVEEVDVAVLNA
ncbi:DNA-3-methyladenine glycosylase, putative [Talaromyces stipitatus ATCC 10500]|uniref:DNA-3-methyladenine glycosylase, putative n=1 Tax=Talaromyces stipitatus (strain ATCC 10500 / CBS 375.48 / QM 6759 / NRRL 1006) TaxID=441959 RepID=B8LTS6_TALSN|nr:DNA-3-methyladenine glycosylase, putative [Talaromyces stipitatus ATCC 10500]EED23668.1 DNA-3-methyladenine glycosylase, putative [Talaromyces stipitatus ATCC 10500]